MAIVKANPNLTLFRDLAKFRSMVAGLTGFRDVVTKSFGHRPQLVPSWKNYGDLIFLEENMVFYTILVLFGLSHSILDKLIIDM